MGTDLYRKLLRIGEAVLFINLGRNVLQCNDDDSNPYTFQNVATLIGRSAEQLGSSGL